MPAPEVSVPAHEVRPVVGHVNLMVDTFLANVSGEDLRPIVRGLLSSGHPGVAKTFSDVARSYYTIKRESFKVKTRHLFAIGSQGEFVPTEHYEEASVQARSLYGIGMGLAALGVLSSMIKGTVGIRWDEDDKIFSALVVLDSDITQAIQVSRPLTASLRDEDYGR
ncbi:hypothetical protein AAF712_013166 [Marasmius tenuissimus]|uniref:Uncharacterized protein n=1 Tax=Marasmius tenuissimus TaxID=585030 RepID=A0ABR2ZGG3_9AGAR